MEIWRTGEIKTRGESEKMGRGEREQERRVARGLRRKTERETPRTEKRRCGEIGEARQGRPVWRISRLQC